MKLRRIEARFLRRLVFSAAFQDQARDAAEDENAPCVALHAFQGQSNPTDVPATSARSGFTWHVEEVVALLFASESILFARSRNSSCVSVGLL